MATIDCVCPAKPDGSTRHPDGDTIDLRQRLDFRGGLTARNVISLSIREDPEISEADIFAGLTETYLVHGIESWTLVGDDGKPLPVTKANIRALLERDIADILPLVDEADELYSAAVVLPLLARASKSSPSLPTTASTSPTTPSSSMPPMPSQPSSTSTIQMDDIGTTSGSLVGVSSS